MTARLLLLATTLTATAALAELPALSVSVGLSSDVLQGRGYDFVDTDDHLSGYRLATGATLETRAGLLDLELAYRHAETQATPHAGTSSLTLQGAELGARWRWPLFAHLHPYVFIGGGWDWATLTSSPALLSQTVSHPAATGLAGVQVPITLGRLADKGVVVLLDLGVGGVLRPGYAFDAMAPPSTPNPNAPGEPLGQATVRLGTLPMSGISYRVQLTLRW